MRKFFIAMVMAIAILFAGVATSVAPAQATSAAVTQATAQPADINGYKFWSPSICVDGSAINGSYYRVAYIAQQWNIRAQGALALDYENDCAAAGYPPSRRMVIGTYTNATDGKCLTITNAGTAGYNGFARWTDGPGAYINLYGSNCVYNQTFRDHVVSNAIGYLLGLQVLNSSGYNSRVMNSTAWSWSNVPLPDINSGDTLFNIYSNVYCLPAGSTC